MKNFNLKLVITFRILIEEARFKYSSIKQEEIKDELAQFNNLCTAWGIANLNAIPNPSPAKQRGNFSPREVENPKKQKTDNNSYYNRFSSLAIDDSTIDIETDDEVNTDLAPPQPKKSRTQGNLAL
ncbi:hypothetical protein NPIL_323171 [Nephila pilipes]|uniref:Uncharacterized protein n=1 Tax=Nephila pilipes TaxID=299642 RepID=A0A8X6R8R1_NEPPI|nr:hypothetical protein NPIL_323171 [Nephila pilipes]